MKGGDSSFRDGATVDRLPFLHFPKPEMGKEENTPLLTLEKIPNPRKTRKSPVSTSVRRTNSLAAWYDGRPTAEPPPRPPSVHPPTHVLKTLAHTAAATRNNRGGRNHGGRRERGREGATIPDGDHGRGPVGRQHVGLLGAEYEVHGMHGSLRWAS